MTRQDYERGDVVVYTVGKHSARPGPRARNVSPEVRGEGYRYQVDKFWIVAEPPREGRVVLQTRRGKVHAVPVDDANLRPARWWERLRHRARFRDLREGLD